MLWQKQVCLTLCFILCGFTWNMLLWIRSGLQKNICVVVLKTRFGCARYSSSTLRLWVCAFDPRSDYVQTPSIMGRPRGGADPATDHQWHQMCRHLRKGSVCIDARAVAGTASNFRERRKAFGNMVQNKTSFFIERLSASLMHLKATADYWCLQPDVWKQELRAAGWGVDLVDTVAPWQLGGALNHLCKLH